MFANGYVGSSEDAQKLRKLGKQREEQRKKFEELQEKKKREAAGLRQFGASKSEVLEAAFKNETVGLVTRQEFLEKRATIQDRLAEDELRERLEAEAAAHAEKERRRKEKEKKKAKSKLSFAAAEEEEVEEEQPEAANQQSHSLQQQQQSDPATKRSASSCDDELPSTSGTAADGAGPQLKKPKFSKLGKDPGVLTNFLPDKDRELQEEELRQQLKKEWAAQQEAVKNEPLEIVYSYWDGTGHRRKVTVRKGDSIGAFLKAVREQCAPQFRELRAVSVDNMMYIKEDLILPHHHTFYELIINKARGKSGPLFDFGVNLDIRILHDATQENQDVHAGKVRDLGLCILLWHTCPDW
eukprot:GHUV01023023.1.p1 GENE.GHUV01023023.1~~GHUV01023023.1.p1  ORF type:complete len:354 (+),score=142.08 GHUV01023023.1:159-1220(+)